MKDAAFIILGKKQVAPASDVQDLLPLVTQARQHFNKLINRVIADELLGLDVQPEGVVPPQRVVMLDGDGISHVSHCCIDLRLQI